VSKESPRDIAKKFKD
jgi:protein transport protein SEC61 subunit alpha